MEVIVREILAELAIPPILIFPDWAALADGYRPFCVYCDACIDYFGCAQQEHPDDSVRSIAYISRATLDSDAQWTWKLAALSGPSNAFEATFGARRFENFRIARRSKASAKRDTTMRESSGGSSFSPRSTTPPSTARAAPTEMPISYLVCQSLSRNTTAVDLAALPPWMMVVSSSSGPVGLALVPLRLPVLAWVSWCPTPRTRFWVGSLSPLRIFVIFARTGHV